MKVISKLVMVTGLAAVLSVAIVPITTSAKDAVTIDESVDVQIGVSPVVGIEAVSHTAGSDASYNTSTQTYTRTLDPGKYANPIGTTRIRITCNTVDNNDSTFHGGLNCKDNGFTVKVAPQSGYTASTGGTTYAVMKHSSGSQYIYSNSTSLNGTASTWTMKVTGQSKTISGTSVYPAVTSGYTSDHIIPATATTILSGNTFETIGGNLTYVGSYDADIAYGVSVSSTQASGTYTGKLTYTVAIQGE